MQDLTGQKFERLTVVGKLDSNQYGRPYWLCRCDCGNEKIIRGSHLCSGKIKSCGCLQKELLSIRKTKHGHDKKGHRTKTYKSWRWMLQRCNDPNNNRYNHYGDRGIKICPEWKRFENFLKDMGEPPTDKHSIDRIDNNGDYNKANCRWATPKQQARNKSNNRLLSFDGRTMCVSAWAEEIGIKAYTLYQRLYLGWSIEKALTTPVRKGRK